MLRNPLLGFLVRFFVLYGLLIFPWQGFDSAYAGWFNAVGRLAFSRAEGNQAVTFETQKLEHGYTTLWSQMTLGNRALADSSGQGKAVQTPLDTRSIGWIPTALTAALILASPVPWRRRLWAFVGGMILVHLFIIFTLQTWIWDQQPAVSLTTLSPFWKEMADDLEYIFVVQLGASFSIPLVIWILVTFRRSDAAIFNSAGEYLRKLLPK